MDLRAEADTHDRVLERRLDEIVPRLMQRHDFEAWIIDSREYNEDPVGRTMLPFTWQRTARRRTLLVFKDFGRQRGAISRYPVGPFPSVWDPEQQPDQWNALADFLSEVTGKIGIDISNTFPLADGLSSTEHYAITRSLDEHHLESAEKLAVGWLETRLPEEVELMQKTCAIAHSLLRRALSTEAVRPDVTSTEDVAWWLAQRARDMGYGIWFHPGVSVQRRGDGASSPADGPRDRVIEPGDLMHIDFGIVLSGYHTDQQQHAYVLKGGESTAPQSFTLGLKQGNRLQEILMDEMAPGRTGNDVLKDALGRARSEGITPVIYTHPLGLHGHAAGATIGLWDSQDAVPGAGDCSIGPGTAWSIELAVEITVEEWDGQDARIMLEEDAFLGADGIDFLDGRQEELWIIG